MNRKTTYGALCIALVACGPTEDPIDPQPVPFGSTGYVSEGGDTGAEDDGDAFCLADPKDQEEALMHQCEGRIIAEFGANGMEALDFAEFGNGKPDDPYENPKVLACCTEFDDSVWWAYQPHMKACWLGLARTFCRTIPPRIWAQATDDLPWWLADQIIHAGNYVASAPVQDWCVKEFYIEGGIDALPKGQGVGIFSHFFDITLAPDYETHAEDWSAIDDPWMEVTDSEIFDIFIPSSPSEQLPCYSGQDNHDQVLVEGLEEPGLTQKTVVEGALELRGPEFQNEPVTGSAALSGARNRCSGLQCSDVGFKQDVGFVDWTLYHFGLHADDGVVSIEWDGSTVASVGRLAVRLMTPVIGEGNPAAGNTFTVPSGMAAFFVTGTLSIGGATAPHIIPARNATDIVFTRHPTITTRWLMASFDLAYTDAEDNEWVVTVTAPIWQ